jgi:hypothetical protein
LKIAIKLIDICSLDHHFKLRVESKHYQEEYKIVIAYRDFISNFNGK